MQDIDAKIIDFLQFQHAFFSKNAPHVRLKSNSSGTTNYHSSTLTNRNATSSTEESYVTSELQKMNSQFTSKGIPVLLGEFGAIRRTGTAGLTGNDLALHLASRTYFDKYIVDQANSLGISPAYWDDSDDGTGNNDFGLFNRSTGALVRTDDARALTGGAALPPPGS